MDHWNEELQKKSFFSAHNITLLHEKKFRSFNSCTYNMHYTNYRKLHLKLCASRLMSTLLVIVFKEALVILVLVSKLLRIWSAEKAHDTCSTFCHNGSFLLELQKMYSL